MNIPLPALVGSEPLAFLSALGALRGASRRWEGTRLAWTGEAPFQPELRLPRDVTPEALIEALIDALRTTGNLSFFSELGSDVKVSPARFGKLLEELTLEDSASSRAALEYLCALGNETIADGSGKKLKPTAWHMTAGQQQFLEMASILLRETTADNLYAALFKPWEYSDPPPALRWDTSGERLYALEARNPSNVQIRTVRGANALGFLALPFFPVSVVGRRLNTRGFFRVSRNEEYFTWPIWREGLTASTISFLLGDSRLLSPTDYSTILKTGGILAVYRSQRSVNDHGYGTLRPAEQVL